MAGERRARQRPRVVRRGFALVASTPLARLTLHTHAWPLFITVMPAAFDLRDVDVYIAEVDALYARRERFATLVDASPLTALPGAHERRRLADWQNATIAQIKRYNAFTATVITSPLMRGAMTAMSWIFTPPNEQVVVATFAEGFRRCIDELRADGHPAPRAFEELAKSGSVRGVEDTFTAPRSLRPPR